MELNYSEHCLLGNEFLHSFFISYEVVEHFEPKNNYVSDRLVFEILFQQIDKLLKKC